MIMTSLKEIKNDFIRIYEDVATKKGTPPLIGRIIAIFFLERRELSQKEISALTGYSLSSVSKVLDQMLSLGIVKRYRDSTNNQNVYKMHIDFREVFVSGFESWMIQANNTKKEIIQLREKMKSIKIKNEERTEFSNIDSMLENYVKNIDSILDVCNKAIKELRESKN
jgi:DNA-binding transcriptional regulator GbsR (MarR family)